LQLKGEHRLPIGPARACELLTDAAVLEACVPGAEAFTPLGDGRYEVTMTAAIGPVRARFKGEVDIADLDWPNAYTLKFAGKSGAAGFTRGEARVSLAEIGSGETRLTYVAHAQVGGKLAQVGSRVVGAAAGAMADRFFAAFAASVAAGGEGSQSAPLQATPGLWSWLKALLTRLFRSDGGG
jgi:uncharacterized protein